MQIFLLQVEIVGKEGNIIIIIFFLDLLYINNNNKIFLNPLNQ